MSEQNNNASQGKPVPVEPVPVQPVPVDPIPSGAGTFDIGDNAEPTPVAPEQVQPAVEESDEPISLVESDAEDGVSKVRAHASRSSMTDQHTFVRPLNKNGTGATRCRLFHSRVAQAPLEHMESSINEWLDSEEIEVKQVGHIIGTMEGKSREPNLILMVWY